MGKQQPNIDELFPKKNPATSIDKGLDINSLFPKKKDDTELSGKTSSTAGKFEVPDNSPAWYDWDNIKKAGASLIDIGKGLGQEIPSEVTRMIGDTISSFGLAVDLGARYSSAGINYLMGDKKQAKKDIDSDPTFLTKYLIDAGNYLSENADQTKDDTLKNWGVSEKNRNPQRTFYDAFSDGDLGDGSAMLFRDVLATVPQAAAAILTGGGSLEAQALRTSGGLLKQTALSEMGAIASSELPAVLSTGMKSQTGSQFKFGLGLGTTSSLANEYRKDNHVTATDFVESIARGVIEGASESLFDSDILAAKKIASRFVDVSDNPAIRGIMASIVGEGEDAAKEKIVRTTTDILGKAFAGGRNEGLEEVASSFGNMLIDATKQGGFTMDSLEKFKKEAVESFIVGSLSGGAISGGAARLSRVKLTDVQKKTIDRYNEVVNDESLSDDARNIAKERIKDILDYNASLSKDNYALIAALPKEKRAEALDYLSKVNQLQDDMKSTKDLAPEVESKIKSYEDKVNQIIEDEYTAQREERRRKTMPQSEIDTEDIINMFQTIQPEGVSIEDMDSAINEVRNKVNNNEEVDQEDVNAANELLYDILDRIEKSELTPEQKKIASEPFFNQITQLESYEKTVKTTEVTTPVQEVTKTTRETGRVERPKTTVLTDRFNLEPVEVTDSQGNKSNYVVKVDENGSLSLVPKVKFSITDTQQNRKPITLDYNFLEFQESVKDENDRVIGARLLDKKTGNTIEISNPELAIDLALKAKQDALGNVSQGVMQQDTTVKPLGEMTSIVKEFVNKRAQVQAPVQEVAEETPEAALQTSLSPVGLPMRRAYVVGMDILKRTGNKILNKISPENKAKINNNVKALKTILPNANVVLYDSREDMIQGLVNQGNSLEDATQAVDESKGLYSEQGNTIHIDVTRMDKETLPHEIFHPLVLKLAQENPAEFKEMRKRISKVLSGSDLAELNKFAELYDDKNKTKEENDNIKAEEFLAQLSALMTSNKIKIDRSRVQKVAMAIKDFIKKIATKMNSKALSDYADGMFSERTKTEDLIKFFEGYARSLRQGAPIDTKYIDNLIKNGKSVRTAAQVTPSVVLRAQMADVTKTPVAGNRLFNEPLADAKRIASDYMKKKGLEYKEGEKITSVDTERAKRISEAYMAMPDDYNIPEVKASYDAMIDETIEQYKEIISNGYEVEINDTEPYKNAQEFIDDLRNNKHFKLLSTLSEFGDTPVTEEMANNDPRLKRTEFKDVNGKTLLANDLFRFVHDFFGHAVRGNSLGAIGEENAWDEHSRMYTPLARKAMTSETRGQNSYVNFSGINDKAFQLRDIARKLRAEGRIEDANKLVNKVYEMMQFAPQKLGLMPDEFSMRDDELPPRLRQQKVAKSKEIAKNTEDKTVSGFKQPSMILIGKVNKKEATLYSGEASINALKQVKPIMYINRAETLFGSHLVSKKTKGLPKGVSKQEKMAWADKIYKEAKNNVISNLLFIYDNIPSNIRDISKLWYDGANIIAQKFSEKYNLSLEQVSAVIATQSPQKPWFDNVHLAHYVIDFYSKNQDSLFTQEAYDYYKKKSIKDDGEPYVAQVAYLPTLQKSIGKKFSELNEYDKSAMIRYSFDNFADRKAPLRIPTGIIVSKVNETSSFSGYDTIAKAVSIIEDGSEQNISDKLGKAFKVRNFYNNIATPQTDNEVTIDTHAIAASYLLPLGSKSKEVKFDEATYAFFADSYREAAKQRGVLAREMQSITWEGARSIFPSEEKTDTNKTESRGIWQTYKSGKTTIEEAQQKIKENGKDLSETDWGQYINQLSKEGSDSDYIGELPVVSGVQQTAESRGAGRGVSGVSRVGERGRENGLRQQKTNKLAPNGKPSNLTEAQYNIVRTPEFKAWFGDWENDPKNASKVVDENGEPMVMYHGTSKDKDFDSFKISDRGAWFSSSPEEASSYASSNDSQKMKYDFDTRKYITTNTSSRVIPVFLNIRNLVNQEDVDKNIQNEYRKIGNKSYRNAQKYLFNQIRYKDRTAEGFAFDKKEAGAAYNYAQVIVLFDGKTLEDGQYYRFISNQPNIKSAVGNNGQFSPTKPSILQQKKFPDALADSREEYANKNKNSFGEVSRYVRKLLSERNINIKKAMENAELEFSLYTMYNKAGASMFGNLKFTEQFNKIYGNLSAEEIKLLDNFVFLRRVIAIEDNFDKRGEEKPKHPMHRNIDGVKTVTTKETALATLNDYMDYLDLEVYDKIYTASDEYFKAFSDILKYKYENGLINKDTYELYKNYNYTPRIFLEHIFGTSIGEEALSPNNFYQRGLNLSTPELKKIKDGSDTGIMVDSAKLLHAAMIATEVRVASNFALKTLYEEAMPKNLDFVKEVEYETNPDGTIKVNEDGSLKYNKQADKDFRIVTFKENGIVKAFQLRENLAKEYFDEELFNKNSKAYKIAQMATGANILRNMATGLNLAFPITNIPVDAISQVQLNNIYDGAGVGVAGQYAKVFGGTIAKSFEIIAHDFGMENKALEDLIYEYGKAGGLMMTLSEEYASKKGLLGQMSKYLGAVGGASEMGSKLTAYKTIKEREIAQFKDKNGQLPTGEDMMKIQTKAAYMARAAMDYHRGGLLTKWLDGFIPYFNVFTQGAKITADYIRQNPTAFTNKIIQTGLFVAALTIYNMAVAGPDYDNDDNEQDLATKIVAFLPWKNEDGTRGKIEIGVPMPIKAFLNIFQNMGEGIYYKLFTEDGERYDEWKSNVNAKFLGMMSPHLATNIPPALKAMIEYSYNLDLWRGTDIVEKMGKVLPEDEGRYDKNVAEFYKIIGTATGASPKRLQKASENFITQSNPLVGLGYAIMDKVVNGFVDLPESQRSKFNSGKISDIPVAFFDKIKGRVYSVTDPKVTYKKGKDIVDKINQEAGSKKQEVKAEMRTLIEKKASVKEMNEYLIKQEPIYRRAAKDYAVLLQKENNLKYPNNKDEYFDIMTGENAEAKAQIMYSYFPHLLMEGNEDLQHDLGMLKLFGADTKKYFIKYHKNKGIPK